MSTSTSRSGPPKKISSWVRPGVLEVRANAWRPVNALMRLDLPTLERPAKAISGAVIGGTEASEPAAEMKCQSPANKRRPASISASENSPMGRIVSPTAPEKAKRGHPVPFLTRRWLVAKSLSGGFREAITPLARHRRIGRVLGTALVAHRGDDRGNADLPVAAGERRFAANLAVVILLLLGLLGQRGRH